MSEETNNKPGAVRKGCGYAVWLASLFVGGFILFGMYRYWLGPLLTAKVAASSVDNCLYSVSLGDSAVRRVRFSPDGSTLAVIGKDSVLADAADGKRISKIGSRRDLVHSLVFSQDSQYFAYKNRKQLTIRTINGKEHAEFEYEGGLGMMEPDSVAFIARWKPDQQDMVATVGRENGFDLYLTSGKFVTHFKTADLMNGIVVSADNRSLALAEAGGQIYIHEMSNLENKIQIDGHEGPIRSIQFSGNSQRLVTVGKEDHQSKVWDAATGELLHTFPIVGKPNELSVDDSGQLVAVCEVSGVVTLWNLQTATGTPEVFQEWSFDREVESVSLSPDGGKMALGFARVVTELKVNSYSKYRSTMAGRRSETQTVTSTSAGYALVLDTRLE